MNHLLFIVGSNIIYISASGIKLPITKDNVNIISMKNLASNIKKLYTTII